MISHVGFIFEPCMDDQSMGNAALFSYLLEEAQHFVEEPTWPITFTLKIYRWVASPLHIRQMLQKGMDGGFGSGVCVKLKRLYWCVNCIIKM